MKIPKRNLTKLKQAFIEIQMPRTPFILENMVVVTRKCKYIHINNILKYEK